MSKRSLREKKEEVNNELIRLKKSASKINSDIVRKKRELERIDKELTYYNDRGVQMSDHALVRYCERALGMDMEKIRKEALADTRMVKAIETLEDGEFPMPYGILRVKNKVIVTIITPSNDN